MTAVKMRTGGWRRWWVFNGVGLVGIGLQLGALAALREWAGAGLVPATLIAVELTVLHNFCWHERWTWGDRTRDSREGVALRLVRFHLANGAISILGNAALTPALAGGLHVHYAAANLAAIALCSIANFLVGDRLVFADRAPHR